MPKKRIVQQGDHLSKIAAEEGFANFHTILDHPDNAELAKRRDPHVLFPGDELAIPDRQDGEESGATENVHKFQTDLQPLYLRCKLLDIDGKPITGRTCDLKIEGDEVPPVVTDGKGIMIQAISRHDKTADIKVHLPASKKPGAKTAGKDEDAAAPPEPTIQYELVRIGNLNPETKMSGQQARLNNMGYFAGFTTKDLDQLLWAAEEFACDHMGKPVKKRPELAPAPQTGEDDPDKADPDLKTGIQDAGLTAKLKTVHGI